MAVEVHGESDIQEGEIHQRWKNKRVQKMAEAFWLVEVRSMRDIPCGGERGVTEGIIRVSRLRTEHSLA